MVSRIRHVGFVVSNIENSLLFYNGILGLEVYKRAIENDLFISRLTGIDDVKLEWIKLIIPEGGLIELLQ
jgi:catechol 2,3-dioxygenase-like lactoylglutathione lyase family enzyme